VSLQTGVDIDPCHYCSVRGVATDRLVVTDREVSLVRERCRYCQTGVATDRLVVIVSEVSLL